MGVIQSSAAIFLGIFLALAPAIDAQAFGTSANVDVFMSPPPPINFAPGGVESDTRVNLILEQSRVMATAAVTLDLDMSKIVGITTINDTSDLTGLSGTASAMVDYASWLLHTDPVSNNAVHTYTGFVEFDQEIIGIVLLTSSLDVMDMVTPEFKLAGGTYPTNNFRGLELPDAPTSAVWDVLTLDPTNNRRIDFKYQTNDFVDQIRILTTPVPEPASGVVFAASALAVTIATRGRRFLRPV